MPAESLDAILFGNSLGSGSSGEVFEVSGRESDLVVKRYYALSIDRQFLKRNGERIGMMPEFEGSPLIHASSFDSSPYLSLMERIDGIPLSKAGSMKEASAWKIIRRLAEILGHAHKHGVYHGHLHPGNILVAGKGREQEPHVLDFGTGLVGDAHHVELGESGFFAAPEQLLTGGKPWEEGRIQKWDVYSFGLVAFWLINERLPRGLAYIKERNRLISKSGGRPVAIDYSAYVEELHSEPNYAWGSSFAIGREYKLCREIIDRCLSIDAVDRPVDLREVRNQFRHLDHQFALEDAEERVLKERRKQRAKLFGARAVAVCLGVSFLAATHYLIEYLGKTYFFENKVSELDQVVVTQNARINHLDARWADTVTDLKQSREAADTFFQKMAQGDTAGGSGVAAVKTEDLEKSRDYYLKTLEDVGESSETALERARALHSLAHIERKMGLAEVAVGHFESAIEVFLGTLEENEKNSEVAADIHSRLADSYENLSSLEKNPVGNAALENLVRAVHHFEEIIALKPGDDTPVTRLAGTTFKLGRAHDAHEDHEKAITAYSKSAELANALVERSENPVHLVELIGKLQFEAAKSLRLSGRLDESINAHVAAMETIETLRGVNGFSPLQSIQMAAGYLELGELFAVKGASAEELDQLYNEALRLLAALNTESPGDVEVAILLCRSLSQLGELERADGKWSSGYRLSVRGIDLLTESLRLSPGQIEGILELAEARIGNLKFMEHEPESAVKIALRGVETAEDARRLLSEDALVPEPMLSRYRSRLSGIFREYGKVCEKLGENTVSKRCLQYSTMEVTLADESETIE